MVVTPSVDWQSGTLAAELRYVGWDERSEPHHGDLSSAFGFR